MAVYVDASAIVPLFISEANTSSSFRLSSRRGEVLLLSDFAATEVASAVSRLVRMSILTADQGDRALNNFDAWRSRATEVEIVTADLRAADRLVRRFELKLRTPDALHLAAARRFGAALATFDAGMAAAAAILGVTLDTFA